MADLASAPPAAPPIDVLLVEDNPADARLVSEMLGTYGGEFRLESFHRVGDACDHMLGDGRADCVLLDLSLPDAAGLEGLSQVRSTAPDVPVIVLTGLSDDRVALQAVQSGAQDFLRKDQVHGELIARSIRYAIERKRGEVELARQALRDSLTGLANRALFFDRLSSALARSDRLGSSVAVLFVDLDRFKAVNSTFSHGAGDELLVAVGKRLEASVRPGDTVARLASDEFAVICEGIGTIHDVTAVAERISHAIAVPFALRDAAEDAFVTASIGIALETEDGVRPEALLRDADAAMHRAKERHSGFEIFDEDLRASAEDRLQTENALHRAMERGELCVHYQPEIGIESGEVMGVEALARWNHPERGLIAPAEFIPLAEETGRIIEIGAFVLEQACRQAVQWAKENPGAPPLTMSVNLSTRQLERPELVDEVRAVLERTGLAAEHLCLEVTESAAVRDLDAGIGALEGLKGLGVRLAIDDFGTGYASLASLKRFPVDILKIDRSFVEGLAGGGDDAAIVSAVVDLAHALGLVTVGEGVETVEQLSALRTMGCDVAQGFHFSRPVAPDSLNGFISGR